MDKANIGKFLGLLGGLILALANSNLIPDVYLKDVFLSAGGLFIAISIYLIGHQVVKNGNNK